jgi:hypothetical protein
MDKDTPRSLAQRFFDACLLLFGGALALWAAVELVARIWPWLALGAAVTVLATVAVVAYRIWRERRW